MLLADIDAQYTRIRNNGANNIIKSLARVYYDGTSPITGELYLTQNNQTIDQGQPLRTVSDVTSFLQANCYQNLILQDTPSAYYRLGEAAAAPNPIDATGHNIGGAFNGGITRGAPGAILGNPATSMTFDGTSGYINLPTTIPTSWTNLSVECWLKLTNNTFTTYPCVLASDFPSTNHLGFQIIVSPSTDGFAGYFNVGNGVSSLGATFGSGVLAASTWYHLVGTYDGATIKAYLNGALVGSGSGSGAVAPAGFQVSIARYPGDSGYLPGTLQEIGLYNYGLSAAQVLAHYNAGIGNY